MRTHHHHSTTTTTFLERERERERLMACKMQRRIALRRKLQILRSLTKSKSGKKKSSIITDTFLYIHNLKLQLQAINQHLLHNTTIQEVRVEKVGREEGYLAVRVRCKEGKEVLPSILQVFEHLNMNVVQATVDCKHLFQMEAIVKPTTTTTTTMEAEAAPILNHAILMALHKNNTI